MLDENQAQVAAYAYAAALEDGGISVSPELLPAAVRLLDKGWLRRGWGEDCDAVFTLTPSAITAAQSVMLGNPDNQSLN